MVAVSLTDTNERNKGLNLFCTKSTLPSNKALAMFKARLSLLNIFPNLSNILFSKHSSISRLGILTKISLLFSFAKPSFFFFF